MKSLNFTQTTRAERHPMQYRIANQRSSRKEKTPLDIFMNRCADDLKIRRDKIKFIYRKLKQEVKNCGKVEPR